LFSHPLESVAQVQRLVGFYVEQHNAQLGASGPDARRDVPRDGSKCSRPVGGATCRGPAATTGCEQGKTVCGVRVTKLGVGAASRGPAPGGGEVMPRGPTMARPCPRSAAVGYQGLARAGVGWRPMARRELVTDRRNALTQSFASGNCKLRKIGNADPNGNWNARCECN
jgi:hypothetical protein